MGLTACGVSDEEYAELDALTAEVHALEKDVTTLKSDKAKLEREIAEQNAKLDDCAKEKADAQTNLESIK
jgi:chromosome segregation ATPase